MFFPERIQKVKTTDRVLEIGPGATPHPRSDAFLELRYQSDEEQLAQNGKTGLLKTDKPVFYYDGGRFPFDDKAFDYVICSHVLEHVPDITAFLAELMRVAPRGYLEFPSFFYDYLYGFDVHLNLLYWDGKTIRGCKKSETGMVEWRIAQRFFYRTLENGHEQLLIENKSWFFHGFEWEGDIVFQHDTAVHQLKVPLPPLVQKQVAAPSTLAVSNPGSFLDPIRTMYHKLTRPKKQPEKDADFRTAFEQFSSSIAAERRGFKISWEDRLIISGENTATTGFDTHYIYHPAWAMRVLKEVSPAHHHDFGSILSFPAQLSAMLPVTFYDVRPAQLFLDNLTSGKADLTALDIPSGSLESVSCMHVLEHIGLGRYGDPIDFDGDLKAITELQRVTKPGGTLLVVVPVGKPEIIFNAHRIYSFEQISDAFAGWKLHEFALIPDNALETGLLRYADPALVSAQKYGCGCFHFQKAESGV